VLVAELSGVLRDIIDTTLSAQPDMEVVVGALRISSSRAPGAHPDVVVIGLSDGDVSHAVETLFAQYPHARILGIAGDGRRAYMHELRPHRMSLGELSPEQLVDVIRRAGVSAGVSGRSTVWE
jgi:DNA-binding NarL/FixJ family response regulator